MSDTYFYYTLIFLSSLALTIVIVGVNRLVKPTNLVGFYLFMFTLTYLVRPVITDSTGDVYQLTVLKIAGLDRVFGLMTSGVFLSLVSFAIGYRLLGLQGKDKRKPDQVESIGTTAHRRMLLLCVLLLIVGYVSTITSNPTPGIRDTDIPMEQTAGGAIYTTTTGYFVETSIYVAAASLLLYALTGRLIIALLVAFPWFLIRLYIGWDRAAYLFYAVGLLALWALRREMKVAPRRQVVLIAVLLGVGLLLTPVIGSNRYFFRQPDTGLLNAVTETTSDWVASTSPISGFEATLYFFQLVPSLYPFAYGVPWIYRYFIQWIPRILWTGKPIPVDLIGWYDPSFYGSAPGAIGEAYWNFGFPGIVIVFFLTGLFLRWFENTYEASPKSPSLMAAYAAFYGMLIHFGRDSFLSMLPTYVLYWGIPFLLAHSIEVIARRNNSLKPTAPLTLAGSRYQDSRWNNLDHHTQAQ
jgi:oligosaccharide repeat unit polymerase